MLLERRRGFGAELLKGAERLACLRISVSHGILLSGNFTVSDSNTRTVQEIRLPLRRRQLEINNLPPLPSLYFFSPFSLAR